MDIGLQVAFPLVGTIRTHVGLRASKPADREIHGEMTNRSEAMSWARLYCLSIKQKSVRGGGRYD